MNEIAWMGSQGGSRNEWIELKNISGDDADLSGWELMNASGKVKINFSEGDRVPSGGFFLVARGASSSAFVSAEKVYSGDLVNTGDRIAVLDTDCEISDLLDASGGWPGGNNETKQTLERNSDAHGWHTSATSGGTPGATNSPDIFLSGAISSASGSSASGSPATSTPVVRYNASITIEGDGGGTVKSDPSGILCSSGICSAAFIAGTTVKLSEISGNNTIFGGWEGACYGKGACSFNIEGPVSIIAAFRLASEPAIPVSSDAPSSSAPDPVSVSVNTSTASSPAHLVIAEVEIAGASTTNDFVKIYNPSANIVDVGGWRLRKRSSTGSDASIKVFPAGAAVGPSGYFTWANSAGGFSETMNADISSTEMLSADNSVALFDASGTVIDALAWGTGAGQYVEGSPFATNPDAGKILKRNFSGNEIVDTDNNAADFRVQ